jgi:hypothetical protein
MPRPGSQTPATEGKNPVGVGGLLLPGCVTPGEPEARTAVATLMNHIF